MTSICIQDLAAYNEGRLVFDWVDIAGLDADDIDERAQQVLQQGSMGSRLDDLDAVDVPAATALTALFGGVVCDECLSKHEEWMVADYDGLPSSLGEFPDIEELVTITAAYDEFDPDAVEAYLSIHDEWDTNDFQERYNGTWDSEESFAENLADDTGMLNGMPELAQNYFDWAAWTRDLFLDGYSSHRVSEGVAVFYDY